MSEPRLTAAEIRWVTAPVEPLTTWRDWRRADRRVTDNLKAIDRDLSAWVGFEPKTVQVDYLLDERLYLRPPDVMATWPAPGRSS